jgi:hypothetical protein
VTTAAPPAPSPSAPAPRPARRWPGRVAALATVLMFGAGSLLLADWLRERSAVDERLEHALSRRSGAALDAKAAPEVDPRMATWLDPAVRYGPARRMPFGRDRALFAVGTSTEGPQEVFPRLLGRMAAGFDAKAVDSVVRAGPSAVVALRLSASIGRIPGGASLVRLPPDVASIRRGIVRTEPGVVVLALEGHERWQYLTFYFPEGLDLDALIRSSRADPRVLDALGPAAGEVLQPALTFSGEDRMGGPSTVICKARGRAGAAIDKVADSLARRGWRDAEQGLEERRVGARVMAGPDATVWMTTVDREQMDGMVTVLIGPP